MSAIIEVWEGPDAMEDCDVGLLEGHRGDWATD